MQNELCPMFPMHPIVLYILYVNFIMEIEITNSHTLELQNQNL